MAVPQAVAQSEVTLSARAGGSRLIGVGIGGFEPSASDGMLPQVREVLAGDLDFSGLFRVMNLPDSLGNVPGGNFAVWRAAGASCYVFGEQTRNGDAVTVKVIDLKTAATLMEEGYTIRREMPRYTAHVIADDIIGLYNGLRGCMASQIAFMNAKANFKELFLIEPDGNGRRQMTFSRTINLSPSWSPDLSFLAYTTLSDENWQVATINVETGQSRVMSNWTGFSASPAVCPTDPDLVALTSNRDGNSEIYVCRTNGKGLRRLTNHPAIDSSPTWSPDGSRIAFISDRTGAPKLYVMNSDGTGIRRLTRALDTYEDSPDWSPRGDRVAFVIMSDYGNFDIATVDVSGEDIVMLTFANGSNENPKWSPDGLKIVFSSNRLGGSNLFVMNWDGTDVRPITNDGRSLSPAWAPTASGNDIRFTSRR